MTSGKNGQRRPCQRTPKSPPAARLEPDPAGRLGGRPPISKTEAGSGGRPVARTEPAGRAPRWRTPGPPWARARRAEYPVTTMCDLLELSPPSGAGCLDREVAPSERDWNPRLRPHACHRFRYLLDRLENDARFLRRDCDCSRFCATLDRRQSPRFRQAVRLALDSGPLASRRTRSALQTPAAPASIAR